MLCNRPSSPFLPSLHTQELAVFYFLIVYTLLIDCFVRKKGTGNLGQEWVSQLHWFRVADERFSGYPRHWFIFNTLAITSTNAVFIDLGLVGGFWEVHLHHKGPPVLLDIAPARHRWEVNAMKQQMFQLLLCFCLGHRLCICCYGYVNGSMIIYF